MELLEAVNTILPFMEERPVTSIDVRHPTVALIIDRINFAQENILNEDFWFNSEQKKFYLSPEGKVAVPTNVLALYTTDRRLNYTIRGGFVYDLDDSTYQIPAPFEARIVVSLEFNELPYWAASSVLWRAAVDAYSQDFGVAAVVQLLNSYQVLAHTKLEREHLRKKRMNSMRSPAGARFLSSLRT